MCRENSSESRGQKRAHPNSAERSIGAPQHEEIEANEGGLRAWGYMPGHVHWKVGTIDVVGWIDVNTTIWTLLADRIHKEDRHFRKQQVSML